MTSCLEVEVVFGPTALMQVWQRELFVPGSAPLSRRTFTIPKQNEVNHARAFLTVCRVAASAKNSGSHDGCQAGAGLKYTCSSHTVRQWSPSAALCNRLRNCS